jgi:hypothetical protein
MNLPEHGTATDATAQRRAICRAVTPFNHCAFRYAMRASVQRKAAHLRGPRASSANRFITTFPQPHPEIPDAIAHDS